MEEGLLLRSAARGRCEAAEEPAGEMRSAALLLSPSAKGTKEKKEK